MFLALDPATNTGWATWKPGMDKPASGAFELPTCPEDLGRVGFEVHVQLKRLLDAHGFERVYYEAPIPPSQLPDRIQLHTIAKTYAIATHIESFCHAMKLRCRQVGQGAWRKTFVGKGGGETTATFKAWSRQRCEQLGWEVSSHDEADACGILDFAIALDPQFIAPWRNQFLFAPFSQPPQRKRVRA